MMSYTISDLAKEFEVTPRTLRHYEELDLLAPKRDGTSRVYSKKDYAKIALICRGKRLGFSLDEIKEFLSLYHMKDYQVNQMSFLRNKCVEKLDRLEVQKKDIDQTLYELKDIQAKIETYLKTSQPRRQS